MTNYDDKLKTLDLVKHRWKFIWFSMLIIIPGIVFIFLGGVRPSIDFTGGSSWEIFFDPTKVPSGRDIEETMREADREFVAQLRQKTDLIQADRDLLSQRERQSFEAIPQQSDGGLVVVRSSLIIDATGEKSYITNALEKKFAANGFQATKLGLNSTGPVIAGEVTLRSGLAVVLASVGILMYLAYAFRKIKNSWRYGICAILAMLHDVLVVVGVFAILGYFFKVEVDALFVTALLTTIGFSVHDSIVVFDRIRENQIREPGEPFDSLVNHSLVQTLARSINTSLTTLFTLSALYLFGGSTIRNFVLALLVGIVSGTYSSIFNASMLLVVWEKGEWGRFFGQKPKQPKSGTSAPVRTAAAR